MCIVEGYMVQQNELGGGAVILSRGDDRHGTISLPMGCPTARPTLCGRLSRLARKGTHNKAAHTITQSVYINEEKGNNNKRGKRVTSQNDRIDNSKRRKTKVSSRDCVSR